MNEELKPCPAPLANPSDKQEAIDAEPVAGDKQSLCGKCNCWVYPSDDCLVSDCPRNAASDKQEAVALWAAFDWQGILLAHSKVRPGLSDVLKWEPLYRAPLTQSAEQDRIDAERCAEILRLCRLFLDDEKDKYNARSIVTQIFGVAVKGASK